MTPKPARISPSTVIMLRTNWSLMVPSEMLSDCRSNRTALEKSPTSAVPAASAVRLHYRDSPTDEQLRHCRDPGPRSCWAHC